MNISTRQFQTSILRWFDQHGRKHLPWQENKTPYRVWLSEIMLQQTQVATAIPYFLKFMQRFPELAQLAKATEDEVLHLWAGLGYYSRARNILRAAKMIMADYQGQFPDTVDELIKVPGIGPSTAGAIVAIAFNQPATILDGNVKRVLSRLHGITDPINDKKVEDQLWSYAEQYTPKKRVADYTQAMMDLGATLCTRSKPACERCPLMKQCVAHQLGIASLLPAKKATRKLPVREATFLIIKKGKHIFLGKRPSFGIWGGLWSLPEIAGVPDKKAIRAFCRQRHQHSLTDYEALTPFRHTFSHYHLDIFPVLIEINATASKVMEADQFIWYNPKKPDLVGLPKPVQVIMNLL